MVPDPSRALTLVWSVTLVVPDCLFDLIKFMSSLEGPSWPEYVSPSSSLSWYRESQESALVDFKVAPGQLSVVSLFLEVPASLATSFWPSALMSSSLSSSRFYVPPVFCDMFPPAGFLSHNKLLFLDHSFLSTSVHSIQPCYPQSWSLSGLFH